MKPRSAYFTPGITRCKRSLRQKLNQLFWMGVNAALIFVIAAGIAGWLMLRYFAPECLPQPKEAIHAELQALRENGIIKP